MLGPPPEHPVPTAAHVFPTSTGSPEWDPVALPLTLQGPRIGEPLQRSKGGKRNPADDEIGDDQQGPLLNEDDAPEDEGVHRDPDDNSTDRTEKL